MRSPNGICDPHKCVGVSRDWPADVEDTKLMVDSTHLWRERRQGGETGEYHNYFFAFFVMCGKMLPEEIFV